MQFHRFIFVNQIQTRHLHQKDRNAEQDAEHVVKRNATKITNSQHHQNFGKLIAKQFFCWRCQVDQHIYPVTSGREGRWWTMSVMKPVKNNTTETTTKYYFEMLGYCFFVDVFFDFWFLVSLCFYVFFCLSLFACCFLFLRLPDFLFVCLFFCGCLFQCFIRFSASLFLCFPVFFVFVFFSLLLLRFSVFPCFSLFFFGACLLFNFSVELFLIYLFSALRHCLFFTDKLRAISWKQMLNQPTLHQP